MSWGAFEAAAPELAAAAQRLLEDGPGVPGVAFLATVGRDGAPRIHPFIPAVVEGDLWAFVIESPKLRDLDRTGKFGLHSRLGDDDESFFCSGDATRADDEATRARVAPAMPFTDIDERHHLRRFTVARALWTRWTTPTTPVHRSWTAA